MENLWIDIKDNLKTSLPGHAFSTWFEPIALVGFNDNELILEVPNQFFYEWLESHYKNHISNAAREITGNIVSVKYTVAPAKNISLEVSNGDYSNLKKVNQPNINQRYTFENFIEGTNNQFARAAAMTVANAPGQQNFNPLLIYGGVGLGKTHLLHAIGNYVHQNNNNTNIILATSEKFTLDFISSIQKNRTVDFSKAYRNADVLLIDDIQFFQKKEQTQEQFFHTFNELYQSGKQIVMTSDKLPSEMNGLTDRLLSRFESGLIVDIQPPDFETRVAILLEKAEQNGVDLPYDMIEFMATHIKSSVRELESTIIRILAYSSLSNCEIDFNLVKKIIKERVGNGIVDNVSASEIIRRVAEKTKVGEKEIVGQSRKMKIAEARQIAIYLCREIMGASLNEIGTQFGGRDHTTVMHACRNIEKKFKEDRRINHLIRSLKQELTFSLI